MAKGRPKGQSPLEWERTVKERLKPPDIILLSYGGGHLDIVGQMVATVQSGAHCKMAVLLVQNKALVELLLGTDLQPQLGFQVLQKNEGGPAVELLPNPELDVPSVTPQGKAAEHLTVHLLQAVRLPACHACVVCAHVDAQPGREVRMFMLTLERLWELGVEVEAGLVEVDRENTVALVLQNPSHVTVHLPGERALGELQRVEVQPDTELLWTQAGGKCPVVGQVTVQEDKLKRVKELH